MAETSRAKERRIAEGFYDKYINNKHGIDIGVGRLDTYDGADPIAIENCVHHDKDMCDATTMEIFEDNTFDYVYASHILEHLYQPAVAIQNWYRICKPGGAIIISIPERDLYERQTTLPSRWNADHKTMWLMDRYEEPHTLSFKDTVAKALADAGPFTAEFRTNDTCTNHDKPWEHPDGDMSLECIIQKR